MEIDWEQKRNQLVYDFEDKTLNPSKLKATDYRFNRSTTLPKPQQAELEMCHELRKTEALRVFDKVTIRVGHIYLFFSF